MSENKDLLPDVSPPQGMLDLPPSYSSTLATGSSTRLPALGNGNVQEIRSVPDHLMFLCSSPPEREPLLGTSGKDAAIREMVRNVTMRKRGKWIESWDPILSDPNALYNTLRYMAEPLPKVVIRCLGVHQETCEHETTVVENGIPRTVRRGETHQITDFDFNIDLSDILVHPDNNAHIHLTSAPPWHYFGRNTSTRANSAVHSLDNYGRLSLGRNRGYQLLSATPNGHSLTWSGVVARWDEWRQQSRWKQYRLAKGVPVWVRQEDMPEYSGIKGKTISNSKGRCNQTVNLEGASVSAIDRSNDGDNYSVFEDVEQAPAEAYNKIGPNLKEWCLTYCSDRGLLKEFVMKKELCGWDLENLKAAITNAIESTGYSPKHLQVEININDAGFIVRPDNRLSRALGNTFIYFLSWIFLAYPLIWILTRCFPKIFGGKLDIVTTTYAMKWYPPLPYTYPDESLLSAKDRLPSLYKIHPEIPIDPPLQVGPKGIHYQLGRREGEWFREWEERIQMAVRMRYVGELMSCERGDNGAGLDGY
ncbi:hypothetical protein L204_105974 [Cryptococcus depauperatus]